MSGASISCSLSRPTKCSYENGQFYCMMSYHTLCELHKISGNVICQCSAAISLALMTSFYYRYQRLVSS